MDRSLTLPTDSKDRKGYPLLSGLFRYFPAALAQVSRISKIGNDKHNPGEPMHHARGKSMDHGDCILRHTMDLEDFKAALDRNHHIGDADFLVSLLIEEAACRAWRSLAELQELCEKHLAAPLAPGARLPEPEKDERQFAFELLPDEVESTFFPLGEAPTVVTVNQTPQTLPEAIAQGVVRKVDREIMGDHDESTALARLHERVRATEDSANG